MARPKSLSKATPWCWRFSRPSPTARTSAPSPRPAPWRGRFWPSAAAYNERPESGELPRLELGVGIAFQGSAPTYWVDSDSRIMISKALNLSDRLSSCSKVARRMLGDKVFALPAVRFSARHGGRRRGRDRRVPDPLQSERRGAKRGRLRQALRGDRAARRSRWSAKCPGDREMTTFFIGQAPIGEGRRTDPAAPRLCAATALRRPHRRRRGSAPTTRSALTTGFSSASRPWRSPRPARGEIPKSAGGHRCRFHQLRLQIERRFCGDEIDRFS